MITDKEWHETMAEIADLRSQLLQAPEAEHGQLRARMKELLEKLAKGVGQP